MKRLIVTAALAMTALLAIGCGSAAIRESLPTLDMALPAPTSAPAPMGSAVQPVPPILNAQNKATDSGGSSGALPYQSDVETDHMVVYTGSLSLEVQDAKDTVNKIEALLQANKGYISSRSLVAYKEDKLRGTITIRVPAVALDSILAQIKALGIKVLREDSKSDDVTQEYVDLDARRKNLEAYELELTKLLDTVRERTGKAEDILAVYNQLTEVRGQIEQIKGRQNYLENTSTLATYTIDLVPHEEVVVVQEGWDPGNTARQALRSLVSSLQNIADLGIVLALYVLPVLLLFVLPIVITILIIRSIVRRRAPKQTAPA